MRILFAGDVIGKSGRNVLFSVLPKLKEKLKPDAVIVNGENAAHGFGLTPKMYHQFLDKGVDVVTMGNHTFDKKDIIPALENEPFLIRPLNYPENTVGRGFCVKTLPNGKRLGVLQILGHVFMRNALNPFEVLPDWLKQHPKGKEYDALLVDVHAEATSEKVALGHFLDGQAGLVVGTHTHVPSADAMILPKGTGYMTDAGMCGDYYSVIGMEVKGALSRLLPEMPHERLTPAEKEGTFCGVLADLDDETGLCREIFAVRVGAHLENTIDL